MEKRKNTIPYGYMKADLWYLWEQNSAFVKFTIKGASD